MRASVAGVVLTIFLASRALAQPTMQFEAFPPDPFYTKLMGAHGWTIYASGPIDQHAAERLDALMQAKKIIGGSVLYLHSPGGNLVGGMKLGRVIRKYDLYTHIGKRDLRSRTEKSAPGFCYSSCALAFLGGEFRHGSKDSPFGVHRFSWNKRTDFDSDLAQIMSASVVEYIRSMGVDTEIFSIATQAGADDIIQPDFDTLIRLRVYNQGQKRTKWTIETVVGAMYLKGERETVRGMNKFMIVCPTSNKPMTLYIIFDAGRNSEDVMRFGAESLLLDGKTVRLEGRSLRRTNDRGRINLLYALDTRLLDAIGAATTVGIALQPTYEAAFYAGFDHMAFAEAAPKLFSLRQICNKRG